MSQDENGEGIVSAIIDGMSFPMVFGHKRLIDSTRSYVQKIAKETNTTIRLVKYKKDEILETIK